MAMMMEEIFTGSGTRSVLAVYNVCSTSSYRAGGGRGAPIKSVTPTGNSAVVNTLKQGQRERHGGPRAR